jgi:hypothetical protein
MREVHIHAALEDFKKSIKKEDIVSITLNELFKPDSCPSCDAAYEVCALFFYCQWYVHHRVHSLCSTPVDALLCFATCAVPTFACGVVH